MRRVRPGYDWGERADRWAGVTSEVIEIAGMQVHYLSAPSASPARDSPTHMLVHPMGSGSWSWMDVIGPLSAGARVIAPDLPGAGRTRPVDRRAARAERAPAFLAELCQALDLDQVVLHGHSLGALVSALFAARYPDKVSHLVLTSPVLPGRSDPPRFPRAWRISLKLAPTLARVPMWVGIRLKTRAWRRWREDPRDLGLAATVFRGGADVSRISPGLLTLVAEEIERLGLPWRIDGTIQAAASGVTALTIDEDRVRAELEQIQAPTLLLWGKLDHALPHILGEQLKDSYPQWTYQSIEGVGHLMPWEGPDTYIDLVRTWLAGQ